MLAPVLTAPDAFGADLEYVRITHLREESLRMTARRRTALIWCQYVLLFAGFSALGYCAITAFEASRYQDWARGQMRNASLVPAEPSTTRSSEGMSQSMPLRLGSGMAPVGIIDIPQVHISAVVAEGTRPPVLRVAVGHIPGTALPGQTGNVALAAHRDTFFRRLGELKSGDLIRITVPGREYLYSVRFTDVVLPNETWVLEPSTGQLLTLVTCYPFYYTGPAPKRFIVRARRLDGE
jgi:sortase A